MKTLKFPLDKYQLQLFTPAIRSKIDIINLWMNAIKIIISYSEPKLENIAGEMYLHIDKMSRIFFDYQDKCFSVNFPFSVLPGIDTTDMIFATRECPSIDSKISSEIISLIKNEMILEKGDVLDFSEPIFESSEFNADIWPLLRDLMLEEDGYIRVDHDPVNKNGVRHPLNHIDVFYSNSSTLKLGLHDKASLAYLLDVINRDSDCHYLSKIS